MYLHINVLEIARTKLLFVVLNLRNFLSVGLEIARTVNQTNTTNFHSFYKTRPGDRKDIHPISNFIQFLTNFKYLLYFSMTGKFECYFEEKLQNFTTEEPITAFSCVFL